MISGKTKKNYVFLLIFLFSCGMLSDFAGIFKLGLICISLFTILIAISIIFVIKKHKKNLKNSIPIVLVLLLTVVSVFTIRSMIIGFMHVSPIHKVLMRTIDNAEKYFNASQDFDLKGTVNGERIGQVLINGPSLDEEGKHYIELNMLAKEITFEGENYEPYLLGGGLFSSDDYNKKIEYVIIDNRIDDYFIKYRSDDISKNEDNDYRFFVVVDSSDSIEKTEDRIEFVMSTGGIPRLAPDGETLEGEIIVFKN
ncbi:hypothetical protein RBH29_13750 [Herbivorax sp. ANBcel31]|uniref:hypothetical protein n=1 Tax=Herbivorax sp. ANBcel31 TaxID=3069754 RepID=UPI0027B2D36E|nr:hypothetical protein [Herbivorax sp. ANBcel31]MDQ2087491.1 hypothetical protein [Herbivorax sp. ANBcel31]